MFFFIAALVLSLFYIVTGYDELIRWYLSAGDCFYRQEVWTTQFFTPGTKKAGNIFSLVAAVISIVGMALTLREWKKARSGRSQYMFTINIARLPWYVAVITLAVVAGVWGWRLMSPSNDEVFSAVNCAELHPFRIISYYMLPNNHVYFNLLNRILFGWAGDLVRSGRLISLLAYTGVLLSVYHLFARAISNHFFAFLALLPVALQFHTWGFAAQARGYEIQLLCGWLSFISVLGYVMQGRKVSLLLNTLFNVAGFLLIPSYLYYYLAQLLFVAVSMGAKRKLATNYVKQQFMLLAIVFICYLPGLCFSGLPAYSGNKWVRPGTDSLPDYLPKFIDSFTGFISDCFCGIGSDRGITNYVVFLLPFLLLFTRRKEHKQVVLFYVALWVTYILYSLSVKRTPFHRTLILHFSITVTCCAYSFYVLTAMFANLLKRKFLRGLACIALFVLPVCIYSYHLFIFNRDNVSWILYGYDVNGTNSAQMNGLRQIPAGSSISFTDDAFYHFYYSRKFGYITYRCPNNAAQYFIKLRDKPFPAAIGQEYEFLVDGGDDYAIYKKRQ